LPDKNGFDFIAGVTLNIAFNVPGTILRIDNCYSVRIELTKFLLFFAGYVLT
jgi:hypothetical protein